MVAAVGVVALILVPLLLLTTVAGGRPVGCPPGSAPSAPAPDQLEVQVDGQAVMLDAEQISIARVAITEGQRLKIPARGWVVAIAAAGAETGIRNLTEDDRDSVGPWAMRPSQGWGTVEQIRNVQLGAQAFYGLAEHTDNPGLTDIEGWQQMTITEAAQAVERSAFPNAYAKWEDAARVIVAQLGADPGAADAQGCIPAGSVGDLTGDCPPTNFSAEEVLTPDALLVLRCVAERFPVINDMGTYPGHDPDMTRAVDVMIPQWNLQTGQALGDEIATWIKDHQREFGVQYIIWSGRIWNIERDDEGWRTYFNATNPDPSKSHRNHVHISVYGHRGTGPAGSDGVPAPGGWSPPLAQPFRVGCGFGCYEGHTGQDYPAPPGTPVYAVTSGTVIRSESITSSGTCTALPICGGTRISYGNLLVLQLAGGGNTTAWYAHLSARRVQVGDVVRAGQVIGEVGYEGRVLPPGPDGSHLHFEIRLDGRPINPQPYLHGKGVMT